MPDASSPSWDDDDVALHEARQETARLRATTVAPDRPAGPQSRLGARTLGALHLAVPGCLVYSDPERLCNANGNGLGGVLIAISETVDGDGEIHRTFRLWDIHKPADDARPDVHPARWGNWRTVGEAACGQESVQGVQVSIVVAAMRQMADEFCRRRGSSGRRMLVTRDHDLVHDMMVLDRVLAGGVR